MSARKVRKVRTPRFCNGSVVTEPGCDKNVPHRGYVPQIAKAASRNNFPHLDEKLTREFNYSQEIYFLKPPNGRTQGTGRGSHDEGNETPQARAPGQVR